MRLFAQSKVHKILSSLALLLVIFLVVEQSAYVARVKQIIIAQPTIVNTSYTLSAQEFEQADEEQLYTALQAYQSDSLALIKVLEASGISLAQFEDRVHTVFVIDKGLIRVQFASDLAAKKLKLAYEHIVAELSQHLLEQLRTPVQTKS